MRIGIDIAKGLAPRDGIGVYTAELVRALMRRNDDDELLFYGLAEPLTETGFEAEFPDAPERAVARVAGDPARDRLDVFHATAWTLPPAYRGPLLFTCHDLTFLTHSDCHTLGNRIHCLTGTLEAVLRRNAIFLAVSEATRQSLVEEVGIAAARIRKVHHAPAPEFERRAEAGARARLLRRFAIDGPFLLAVGTLEPRKNLSRLLEAYAGLPEIIRQRFSFVLAGGEGWKLDESQLPDLPTVRRLGAVDRDALIDLMTGATVFAYPSLAEGFGLPVLEAMACGAPVLTSNLSSLPEVAGGAALLVDPYDADALRRALRRLLESPAERERLRQAGFERAAGFSWERTALETREIYRELLGTRESQ